MSKEEAFRWLLAPAISGLLWGSWLGMGAQWPACYLLSALVAAFPRVPTSTNGIVRVACLIGWGPSEYPESRGTESARVRRRRTVKSFVRDERPEPPAPEASRLAAPGRYQWTWFMTWTWTCDGHGHGDMDMDMDMVMDMESRDCDATS